MEGRVMRIGRVWLVVKIRGVRLPRVVVNILVRDVDIRDFKLSGEDGENNCKPLEGEVGLDWNIDHESDEMVMGI